MDLVALILSSGTFLLIFFYFLPVVVVVSIAIRLILMTY